MSQPPKQSGRGISDIERQERAAKHNRKREEYKNNADIVVAINAVANQLSTNEKAQDESDIKRGRREKITIGLVFAAFVAAAGGDVIFYRTMMDDRDAQRPYIWDEAKSQHAIDWIEVDPSRHLGVIRWTWNIYNYGKSLALNVNSKSSLTLLGNWPTSVTSTGHSSYPMPPTDSVIEVTYSKEIISKDDFIRLMSKDGGITLHAKVTYFDIYGTVYKTGLCQGHAANSNRDFQCEGSYME